MLERIYKLFWVYICLYKYIVQSLYSPSGVQLKCENTPFGWTTWWFDIKFGIYLSIHYFWYIYLHEHFFILQIVLVLRKSKWVVKELIVHNTRQRGGQFCWNLGWGYGFFVDYYSGKNPHLMYVVSLYPIISIYFISPEITLYDWPNNVTWRQWPSIKHDGSVLCSSYLGFRHRADK